MKILLVLSFFLIPPKIFTQDTSIVLNRFDQKMIHIYKNGYLINNNYYKISKLKNEIRPGMPSFEYFSLSKKFEKKQTIFSVITLGGTFLWAIGTYDYEYRGSNVLFWSATIAMLTSMGLTISFESKARKNLHLAIKARNREILTGY